MERNVPNESPNLITFEAIQGSLGLKDPKLLKKYLKLVFNDFVDTIDEYDQKIITKMDFYKYFDIPIFIVEKIFTSFSKTYRDYLCEEEFVDNLYKLYMGSFEETVKIIFDILDYDQDGILIKDEIKIFLSYLPLEEVDEDCQPDIKADKKKINKIISLVNEKQKKSLEEIDNMVNETFEICDEIMDLENFTQMIKEDNSEIFLQILCFLYEKMPFTADNVEALKIRKNKENEQKKIETENKEQIYIKIPQNNSLLSSVSRFLKKHEVIKTTYENWVYNIIKFNECEALYLTIINKDIFFYKSDKKKYFVNMHNLTGCFVQEGKIKKYLKGKELFPIEIDMFIRGKEIIYYTDDKKKCKEIVEKIQNAIGYKKFSDYYEIKEEIGKGSFGKVYLGLQKKTGLKVAIKTINRKYSTKLEMLRNEIDILKHCHHPNIVRLLDYFEEKENIYIILEYVAGGNLHQYFKKKSKEFTERQAANIMIQIASAVKYLHQYGIVHKDLKPGNIMITEQNEFGIIKITDFGISLILSPTEGIKNDSGSLEYCAPEILTGIVYNNEVDIWAMGIILYQMLSGTLPFSGKDKKQSRSNIVKADLKFKEDDWKYRSPSVQDLIKRCLVKSLERRISIDDFINHPWIQDLTRKREYIYTYILFK